METSEAGRINRIRAWKFDIGKFPLKLVEICGGDGGLGGSCGY